MSILYSQRQTQKEINFPRETYPCIFLTSLLYTPLEAVSLIAYSLLTVAQMRSTQHVDAALPMYPASRVFHSAGSGYKHVQSPAPVVRRSSRSLGTVRCSKHCSSADADASVRVHTSAGSRKKRIELQRAFRSLFIYDPAVVPAKLPGDNRTRLNLKYQFKI